MRPTRQRARQNGMGLVSSKGRTWMVPRPAPLRAKPSGASEHVSRDRILQHAQDLQILAIEEPHLTAAMLQITAVRARRYREALRLGVDK